jgi:adenylosuccinate synthase
VIVRYNGGANAGHSVQVGSERYALHLVPSGILHPDKICVIGNGVVVDPEKLLQEIDGLRQRGIEVGSNLLISDRAHVVMPYHKEQDAALEDFMAGITRDDAGSLAIGTTRSGIGPAYGDKVDRSTAIRMGDLLDAAYLRERLHVICGLRTRELKALGVQAPPLDPDALAKRFGEAGERLRPHITDTVYGLHDAVKAGKRMLFEGANASLLDIDHGTYPYVTSSNCSTLGIPAGTGLPMRNISRVLGIMKAYSTRVGGGPFLTELLDAIGAASVVGVDVGSAQLHPQLRTDPRVLCVEKVNARALTADDLWPLNRAVPKEPRGCWASRRWGRRRRLRGSGRPRR